MVRTFREKPQVDEGWINGGFFVFERAAFDLVRPEDNVSLEVVSIHYYTYNGNFIKLVKIMGIDNLPGINDITLTGFIKYCHIFLGEPYKANGILIKKKKSYSLWC